MNTGGKNVGEKPTDRRKRAIYDVVTNTHPALVLFQEFSWTSIRSRACSILLFTCNGYFCFRSHILSINTPGNIKFGSLKII
jgi:hypothetical protein